MCTAGIDDLEGNRTLAAIRNVNGIVQFYIGHGHVDSSAPTTWIDVEEDHYEVLTNTSLDSGLASNYTYVFVLISCSIWYNYDINC